MEEKDLIVKIKALTPIWTGGVEGKPDRLHETGIIGSMRWWFEAIVRGLDGYACDPTSDNRCELSGKEKSHEERVKELCPACYLFGCGGWKRRFRLEVFGNATVPFQLATLEQNGKFNHWWLSQIFENSIGTKLPFGKISLSFRHKMNGDISDQNKALLSIMAHIGGLGAKTQYGFGQFDWEDKMMLKDASHTIRQFLSDNKFRSSSNEDKWYSLNKFWYYEFSVPTDNRLLKKFQKANVIGEGSISDSYLPVSFDVRYKIPSSETGKGLREAYYLAIEKQSGKARAKQKTRSIFGTLENDKLGSRVFVSHLFKRNNTENSYWLKVWGFTDDLVGKIVVEELKEMFVLKEAPDMKTGKAIINDSGGEVQ